MVKRLATHLAMLLILTACGGGGGGSSLPATIPAATAPATAATGLESVKVSIFIPSAKTTASQARRPAYVSSSTQSAAIAVNGLAPVVANLQQGCTLSTTGRSCSVTVTAPIGTDTFVERLYAGANATGSVLSQGQTTFAVVAGENNVVNLALGGVPSSVVLLLSNASPTQGTPATIALTATIVDAAGKIIIGGDPLDSPITISNSDKSGITSLGTTQINTPNDATNIAVTYSGGALTTPAVFSATSSGLASTNVTNATLSPIAFNDYSTFGYDNGRTVFNPNTTAFTAANVENIHLAWQANLGGGDYNTQTQPVLATKIPGHSGLLLVGGGSGNVYGYDATSGALVWTRNLGQELYTCENSITYYFGIGGTVAYDAASQSFYVVGNSNAAVNAPGKNMLYHMDAATGAQIGSGVEFAPTTIGPSELNFSHTSVTLSNGTAYVGTAATCDISSWRGRVAAVNVNGPVMTLAQTFFPVWNATTQPWGGGGVWGWGGVSLDDANNVYTGTGNTDNGTTNHGTISPPFVAAPAEDSGYGEAFLKLSAGLGYVDSDHPTPQTLYSSNPDAVDLDLNGTPVIFKPLGTGCDTMAAIQGKSGTLFLYDTNRIGSGAAAKYQLGPTTYTDEFIGDPAYSPVTGLIYAPIPVAAGSLYGAPGMLAINPGCGSPSPAWHASFGPDSDPGGVHGGISRSVPAVSAGGVVFVGTPCQPDGSGGCSGSVANPQSTVGSSKARKPKICCTAPGTTTIGGAIWALDASSGTVLNGGKPLFTTSGVIRVPPTIDGNWMFVLDNDGNMYGLTIDSGFRSISTKYRSADARSRMRWEPRPMAKPH